MPFFWTLVNVMRVKVKLLNKCVYISISNGSELQTIISGIFEKLLKLSVVTQVGMVVEDLSAVLQGSVLFKLQSHFEEKSSLKLLSSLALSLEILHNDSSQVERSCANQFSFTQRSLPESHL